MSQVSRALARIEKSCGARLIHRSTHGLALTAEGETFLDCCHKIGGTLELLEGEFATKAQEPSGLVRVAASTVMALSTCCWPASTTWASAIRACV